MEGVVQHVGRDTSVAQFSEDRPCVFLIPGDVIGEFFVCFIVFLGAYKDGINPSAGQCVRGFDESAGIGRVAVLILFCQNDAAFFLVHKFSFLTTDPVVPCRICLFLFQKPVSAFSLYRFYVAVQDNSSVQSCTYSTKYDTESGITKNRQSLLSKTVGRFLYTVCVVCLICACGRELSSRTHSPHGE